MLQRTSRVEKLMGNRFELTAVHEASASPDAALEKGINEIKRIEALLSTFKDDSETALINASAGERPVKVSAETCKLIERCLRISALTQGAFDISYGSVHKKFWNFDTSMHTLPAREDAKAAVKLVDYRKIVVDTANQIVFLQEKGMRIGFGGIGKGYAAEKAREVMKKAGINSGIINASGDLCTWGNQPDGNPWTIGIAAPGESRHPFASMEISDMGIATSGNYEKFVEIGGKRYSHTIDPRTGWPVSGISSVTIVCPHAELADAMATPVMVMGIEAGLHLINQMKQIACVIVDEDNRVYTSKNIRAYAE